MNNFWHQTFTYRQNFLIITAVLFVGILLDFITKFKAIVMPAFPYNALFAVALVAIFFILSSVSFLFRFFKIAISKYFVIILFVYFFIYVFISTFLRIDLLGGFSFAFIVIMLLFSLFLSTLLRIKKKDINDLGFILNHGGMFFVLLFASLSKGDLIDLKIDLVKNKVFYGGIDSSNRQVTLPFALELLDFQIKEYDLELGVFDPSTLLLKNKKIKGPYKFQKEAIYLVKDFSLKVLEFFPEALISSNKAHPVKHFGATPYAQIEITNLKTGRVEIAEIMLPGPLHDARFVKLDDNLLGFKLPRPKEFLSKLKIHFSHDEKVEAELIVNRPLQILDWKIYQYGYDERMGKWSNISTLELVYDPWLAFIYWGLCMILLGQVHLFFVGRKS